jgi:hypothetical protein
LSAGLQQVVDGLFVGCPVAADLPIRHDSDAVVMERAVITLAAFDGSFWLVSGPNEMLDRLSAQFQSVAEVAPWRAKPSAWDR